MKKIHFLTGFIIITGTIAAQNVGIGTTAPASKLHIKGSVDTTQLIIDAHSTQSNTHPLIKLRNSSGTDLMWIHSDDATNSFVGLNAGRLNTGTYNTFMGSGAGFSNTTGGGNTSNGYQSLYYNTTGFGNTANGSKALYFNTTGYGNVASGGNTMYSNTTGYGNTASGGYGTLASNTAGYFNTAEGYYSMSSNTTGNYNVAIGFSALYSNADGNYNTALGVNADVSASYLGDATAIGSNAIANGYDKVVIGGPYIGTIVIGGYANWSNFSDGRFKENIQEDVPGLSFISKLKPVTYQINNKKLVSHITHLMPDSIAQRYQKTDAEYASMYEKKFTGFVAQDVEQAARELGYDFDGVNTPRNETDHYSISYASFVIPLVKAVQEQQAIIEKLQKQVEAAKAEIPIQTGKQQKMIEELKKEIEGLKKLIKTEK